MINPESLYFVARDNHLARVRRAEAFAALDHASPPPTRSRRRSPRHLIRGLFGAPAAPAETAPVETAVPATTAATAGATAGATRRFGAVLLTDIVGSTRQSVAFGDTRWHSVLNRHDEITRHLVARHGGDTIKHTGDGVLATFAKPSDAVTCGLAVLEALNRIGVRARSGAHVGEIELRGDGDITGVTVNVAARVEQRAASGELWVSSTLRDTMLGSDLAFDPRGDHDLTGTDETWGVYSVSRQAPATSSEDREQPAGDEHPMDRLPAGVC